MENKHRCLSRVQAYTGIQGKHKLHFPEIPTFALLNELILYVRDKGFLPAIQLLGESSTPSSKTTKTLDIQEILKIEFWDNPTIFPDKETEAEKRKWPVQMLWEKEGNIFLPLAGK